MIKYDILTGNLYTDLDTPYYVKDNCINVYLNVNWTGEDATDYLRKEKLINDYKVENELFSMVSWCDVTGYHYWVIQQEETNYVSVDLYLKKQPNEYTEQEMILIRDSIIEAESYFENVLL